ncbi:MAG: PspC domain-containing protein [Actinomycetota bacterium]|nr:PspC domain-containing protein [Actinomycetota bacterium]
MTSDPRTEVDPSESSLAGARAWFAKRGLTRPRRGKWVAGVAAGFSRRYGWNPLVVRLLIIASIVLPGSQVVVYVVLWVLMPRDAEAEG